MNKGFGTLFLYIFNYLGILYKKLGFSRSHYFFKLLTPQSNSTKSFLVTDQVTFAG